MSGVSLAWQGDTAPSRFDACILFLGLMGLQPHSDDDEESFDISKISNVMIVTYFVSSTRTYESQLRQIR